MPFLIGLTLTFFVQLLAVSWYAIREGLAGRRGAMPYKFLCGLLFVADLVLAAAIRKPYTADWFWILSADLLLCFAATLVRNTDRKRSLSAAGALYGAAFIAEALLFTRAAGGRFGTPVFTVSEVVVWATLTVAFAALTFDTRLLHPGKRRAALIVLAAAVFLAVVKAVRFGILCQRAGGALQSLSFTVVLSALGLLIAAGVEIYARFGGGETARSRLVKSYCYFFGRMLLACGVLFAGG